MKTNHIVLKVRFGQILKRSISIFSFVVAFFVLSRCEESGTQVLKSGQVTFSFAAGFSGGRTNDAPVPAFVSYTVKKSDGSITSNKIELYEFNGSFVTQPQQLNVAVYTLEQFIILDETNKAIYATPLADSELADLVERPLPLSFDITSEEITNVVPEVLALEDYTPEDFGYIAFGFEIVETMNFDASATIADHNQHGIIDYTLEIIAKDAPLGTVKWTKTIPMNGSGEVRVPAKYAHYTFKATKAGYIPHVQHFLKPELSGYDALSFEFIPESLEGFFTTVKANGTITFYYPNDQYRLKLYARVDVAEGYFIYYGRFDKSATTRSGLPISFPNAIEFFSYSNRVNVFDNTPFANAQELNLKVTLPYGSTQTMSDVDINSSMHIEYDSEGAEPPHNISSNFKKWKGQNNP